jgi:hypothetical protein
MSKKDPTAEAHKVLLQINENLSHNGENLRFVSVDFVRRGDFTAAIIHAFTGSPVQPQMFTGWGFSKRHPEDESDRTVGYEFSLKRAIDDTFALWHEDRKKRAYHN